MAKWKWEVWTETTHYKVAIRVYESWAGAGYNFAKNRFGFIRRFLTKKSAQKYADFLNAQDRHED